MGKAIRMREVIQSMFIFTVSLQKIADRVLRSEIGLTLSQFRMLMVIDRHPGSSQKCVADFWGVEEASVSRQIDILAKKKFVVRTTSARSKREHILALTKGGKRMLGKAIAAIDRQSENMFGTVTQKQRRDLSVRLEQLLLGVKHERESVHAH